LQSPTCKCKAFISIWNRTWDQSYSHDLSKTHAPWWPHKWTLKEHTCWGHSNSKQQSLTPDNRSKNG
jgi:hypothetical protein